MTITSPDAQSIETCNLLMGWVLKLGGPSLSLSMFQDEMRPLRQTRRPPLILP